MLVCATPVSVHETLKEVLEAWQGTSFTYRNLSFLVLVFTQLPIYQGLAFARVFFLARFGLVARTITSYVFVVCGFIDSVAKGIGSLSDCRGLTESATEGLSSIAKGRLVNACGSGVGVGGGLFGDSQKRNAHTTSLDSYVSKSSVKK